MLAVSIGSYASREADFIGVLRNCRYVTAWDYQLIETEQTPTAATGANL
jgi:hypothetical protein